MAGSGLSYIVTSNLDDISVGTLRDAITYANNNPGTTITFDPDLASQTITLASALPAITASVTIDGSELVSDGMGGFNIVPLGIAIDGATLARVFFVQSGDVSFRYLTIENGHAAGGNGGDTGGGGGLGAGAAIFVNSGNTTVSNVDFTDNVATGGNGGASIADSPGGGGGGLGTTLISGHSDADGGSATPPNGGGGGGGLGGAAGIPGGDGGAGGDFAGGGGGGLTGGNGGAGGFGGGGGGGSGSSGAGGYGGAGNFGGGGGGGGGTDYTGTAGTHGTGGAGGGSGADGAVPITGGGDNGGGGGGAAFGGAIFVRDTASLTLGDGTFTTSAVTHGNGTGGGADGVAAGSDLFLMSSETSTYTFAPDAGHTLTFNGTIADDSVGSLPGGSYTGGTGAGASIFMSGAGTVVYTAGHDYSYSGATTVANGILQVDGTVSHSAITVNGVGTLDGIGTVGAVTVLEGGTLAPGDGGIGTLTATGNVTFSFIPSDPDVPSPDPGSFAVDVGLTGSDLLNVTGTIDLANAHLIGSLTGTFNASGVYTIIHATAGVSGTFDGLSEGSAANIGGHAFAVSYGAEDVVLTAVANGAPGLTGWGPSATFLENTINATPQIIDPDVTFNDVEGNFNGGTLTVTGLLASDTVSVNSLGFDPDQFFINGSDLQFEGNSIGTISGGEGTTLTITFSSSSATSRAIDDLIQNLTYANSLDAPVLSHVLTLTVTDGGSATTGGNPITINITPEDDGYSGTPTITGTTTENQVLTASAAALIDPDGLGPFSYQWQRDTGSGFTNIAGAVASTYTLDDPDVGGTVRVLVNYTDGGGTATSAPSAATAMIAGVNDAPVAHAGSASGNEDTIISASASATDVDNSAVQLTYSLVGANGGAAHGIVALNPDGTFTYTPATNFYGSDSFSFKANDGSLDSNVAIESLTINAVNDPPVLNQLSTVVGYVENAAPSLLSPSLTMSDVDSANLAGATVHIAGGVFAGDGDLLAAATAGTAIAASYNAASETLTLSGSDTLAHYQQVLASVAFSSTSDNPTNYGVDPSRTVEWQVNDGSAANNLSTIHTTTINITAVNDPPVLNQLSTVVGYVENAAPSLLSPSLTMSDVDSANLVGATVHIAGGVFAGDGDLLAAATAGTAIAASYNAASETLTLSGSDTLAHYQQVLASVAFSSTSDNPTNYGVDPSRTVEWQVNDGSAANNLSTIHTTTINVTAMDDPPTSVAISNASIPENSPNGTVVGSFTGQDPDSTSLTFSLLDNANGLFALHGSDLVVADGARINFAVSSSDNVTVQVADESGLTFSKVFTIGVIANPGSGSNNVDIWQLVDGHWASSVSPGSHPSGAVVAGVGDFNGDGTSDVLWQDLSTGNADNWILANGKWAGSNVLGSHPGSGWQISGVGDFNGDGMSDVFWLNPASNQTDVWELTNGHFNLSVSPGVTSTLLGWQFAGIGDVNDDGTSDVLWQNASTGNVQAWEMVNGTSAGTIDVGTHPTGWQLAGVGDFNHDGTSDAFWFNSSTGQTDIWELANGQWAASVNPGSHPGAGWQVAGIGDFNHDGTSDVLWRNANTGDVDIWKISNGTWAGSSDLGMHPAGWQLAGVGDFNHDGTSDVLWHHL